MSVWKFLGKHLIVSQLHITSSLSSCFSLSFTFHTFAPVIFSPHYMIVELLSFPVLSALTLPLSSPPVTLRLLFSPSNRAGAIFTQNAIVLLERTLP